MAFDLILGVTKKNWSRGAMPSTLALSPLEPTIECTDREKAGLEKLASIKMRAESGDRLAKIQWISAAKRFRSTKAKAVAGDPRAKRSLAILKQAGFLQKTQAFNFSSRSDSGWFWSSPSYDDGWKRAKEYGKAVESKDSKTASQSLTWMHDNKWTEVSSKGITPFYTSVTWSNPSFKDKIRLTFPGKNYQLDRISGYSCLSGREVSWRDAIFNEALSRTREYGTAFENKDRKASRDAIEWMILQGWKASGAAGTFPFYTKIIWSHVDHPGKKIVFAATGSTYAVSMISGETLPRKAWADSEAVPQGARKPWDDHDSPPLARKSWIDDEIPILTRRARAGDVSAQIALRKIALRKSADDEEMSLGDSFMGDEREESSFIGDAIPHDTYRAAVMLTAIKDAGGRNPTTKDFFAAKTKVDNKLGNMGVSIYLPGARPARRTY